MADLVFAFDAALDRPIPVPPGAPAAVVEVVATAPWAALQVAAATARQARAAALVLFGSTLDPLRASPAQAAFTIVRRANAPPPISRSPRWWLISGNGGCSTTRW